MNVLIIHRQQSFLKRVKEKFLLGGWRVQTTDNGLDGLLTARHNKFDLILCGFDLPVVTGTEVVRSSRLLSLNQTTPVIFLKAGSETDSQIDLVGKLEAQLMDEEEIESNSQMATV